MLRTADHLSALYSGKGIYCRASELKYTRREWCNEKCNRVVFFYFIYCYFYFFSGQKQKLAKDCWRKPILLGGILPVRYTFPFGIRLFFFFFSFVFCPRFCSLLKKQNRQKRKKKGPCFREPIPHHVREKNLLLYIRSEAKAVLQDRWVDSHDLNNAAFYCGLAGQQRGTGRFGQKLSLGMPKPFVTNQ